MNLHEYQAKEVLKKFGVKMPAFGVASSPKEATQIAERLGLSKAVLKVQVHAGGRGKAGGVKFAKNREEVGEAAGKLIGMKMVNEQTGPLGVVARQVLIAPPVEIAKEYYAGVVIDRQRGAAMLILSPEGGMEIEEIARKHPDKILTLPIPLSGKLRSYQLLDAVEFMGWRGEVASSGRELLASLARAFVETDASLLEINPLVLTTDGELLALDAKLSLDDNALYRQEALAACYDPSQQSAGEVAAKECDLAYIALDGQIGCLVNGAGLAMATMDLIHHFGGAPANFLDVGGSATADKVAAAFRIILSDPKVKGILVNIFGGIMNCATIAEGIIAAAREQHIGVPIVVRLEGNNVDKARRQLEESKLPLLTATSLSEAAEKVVQAVGMGPKGA